MSSFTFPPPPPPPPSAASLAPINSTYNPYGTEGHRDSSNYRGRGRSRGQSTYGRGYGRGYGDYRRTFSSNQNNMAMRNNAIGSNLANTCNAQSSHGHEFIPGQSLPTTHAQAQTNAYNWLCQSMHMYSQASALASQYQGQGAGPATTPVQGAEPTRAAGNSNSLQSQQKPFNGVRGIKRKRGDVRSLHRGGRGSGQASIHTHSGNRMQVAPAVPDFGFSLPVPVQEAAPSTEVKDNQPFKKKQKHNLLGLTPQSVEDEEIGEEEEEADELNEEASGANTGTGLQFEYNGQVAVLRSEKEVAAWIAERKKRYPTKARIAQKNAEALKRRQEIKEARERAMKTSKNSDQPAEKRKIKTKRKIDADGNGRANAHLERAEKLRKKLKAAEAKAAKALAMGESEPVTMQDSPIMKSLPPKDSSSKEETEGILQDAQEGPHPTIRNQQSVTRTNLGLNYSSTSSSSSSSSVSSSRESSPLTLSEMSDSSSSISTSGSITSSPLIASESATENLYSASSGHLDVKSSVDPKIATNPTVKNQQNENTEQPSSNVINNVDDNKNYNTNKRRPCKFFQRSGQCRNGQKCKFSHEFTPRANRQHHDQQNRTQNKRGNNNNRKNNRGLKRTDHSGSDSRRVTLSERLQMQEQHQREQHLLHVIKVLGQRGVLNPE